MISPERQLQLVESWFDRPLTKTETAKAKEMIAAGDRPPYIARYLDMHARVSQKVAPLSEQPGLYGGGMR